MTQTQDILLYDAGSGGEIDIQNNDIALVEYLYQQVYLALFGGNVEAITTGNETTGEIRNDWWGNALLFNNDKTRQFNSLTENALINTPLSSSGRITIERAVQADLQYLSLFAKVAVDVVILSSNRVQILVTLTTLNNQSSALQVLWDNAKNQLIIEKTL